MPAKIRFTLEQIAKMVEKYQKAAVSTSDIAQEYGVAKNTINGVLKSAGVVFNKGAKLSAKAKGRISARKGYKFTEEERKRLSVRSTGNKNCVGRILSEESRIKMSASMVRRNTRWAEEGRLLPPEEIIARNHVRQTGKRLVRRILTMTRIRKDKSAEELLGYTKQELRTHIEGQFRDGMSWSNRNSFHIDHIIPVAHFIKTGITDIALINALSNLQVLTPTENHKKSDKLPAHFINGKATYTNGVV